MHRRQILGPKFHGAKGPIGRQTRSLRRHLTERTRPVGACLRALIEPRNRPEYALSNDENSVRSATLVGNCFSKRDAGSAQLPDSPGIDKALCLYVAEWGYFPNSLHELHRTGVVAS